MHLKCIQTSHKLSQQCIDLTYLIYKLLKKNIVLYREFSSGLISNGKIYDFINLQHRKLETEFVMNSENWFFRR